MYAKTPSISQINARFELNLIVEIEAGDTKSEALLWYTMVWYMAVNSCECSPRPSLSKLLLIQVCHSLSQYHIDCSLRAVHAFTTLSTTQQFGFYYDTFYRGNCWKQSFPSRPKWSVLINLVKSLSVISMLWNFKSVASSWTEKLSKYFLKISNKCINLWF